MPLRYKLDRSFSVGSAETSSAQLAEGLLVGLVVTGSVISGSLVSFLVSTDGVSYIPLFDKDSTEVTLTVSASPKAYHVNHEAFLPWNYIKARLGSSGSAKLQATYNAEVQFVFDTK